MAALYCRMLETVCRVLDFWHVQKVDSFVTLITVLPTYFFLASLWFVYTKFMQLKQNLLGYGAFHLKVFRDTHIGYFPGEHVYQGAILIF